MYSLDKLTQKLKDNGDVDALFVTGSHGTAEQKDYSDIDLIVVIKENKNNIRSVFTWIDDKFADVFFFDRTDLRRIESEKELEANGMDSLFVSWLKKATILFDKSGKLSKLAAKTMKADALTISAGKQKDVWQKINYNYIANKRYYESGDPLYHEALELRLLYSVIEIITGYLSLHNIPWRGEKDAVKYLKGNEPSYYNIFKDYTKARNLEERFKAYEDMVKRVFPTGYGLWTTSDVITILNDQTVADNGTEAAGYWDNLVS